MELAQLLRPAGRTAADFSSASDDELVRAVANGSHGAFEALYDRHCSGMLSLARQLLDSAPEAEDAVQHAFMAAYREIGEGVVPAYPRAWLYAIVRNRSLTILRDRREVAAEVEEPSTVGLAEEVERRSDLRELVQAMHRLPEEQRTALALFELGGLSQTEIAQAMDSTPEKVKALVYQARTNLSQTRAARDASCESIREQLATLRGGRLNTRELRDHVAQCEGCAEYALMVREQRRRLAIVLPVVPLLAMKVPAVASLTGAGAGVSAGGAGVGSSVGRKLVWLRPRGSAGWAVAGTAGVATAAAVAAVAAGGGDDPPKRNLPPRPAIAAPAAPVATAPPAAAKPASKPKRRRAARKRRRASPARQAPAPAPERAPTPEPVAAPEPEPTPVASTPPRPSSPPPAPQPAEPPGQNFDLTGDPPPTQAPETPASEPSP
jgi:RNA polymerase sigma factor (sigma-70 family)